MPPESARPEKMFLSLRMQGTAPRVTLIAIGKPGMSAACLRHLAKTSELTPLEVANRQGYHAAPLGIPRPLKSDPVCFFALDDNCVVTTSTREEVEG